MPEGVAPPDKDVEVSRGQIWKRPFPGMCYDGCRIYLPYLTEALAPSKQRPKELGHFAKEAFRALDPGYLEKRMQASSGYHLERMLGHIWELGCTLRRLADDQEIRSGESSSGEPLRTYPSGGTRTERELEYQLTKDRLYTHAIRFHALGEKKIRAEEDLRKAQQAESPVAKEDLRSWPDELAPPVENPQQVESPVAADIPVVPGTEGEADDIGARPGAPSGDGMGE